MMAACGGDGGSGGAGMENDHLARANHADGGGGDTKFFLPMEALLLLKRLILKRPRADGKSATVCALQQTLVMERLEVLADSDEGGAKAFGEIADENAAIVAHKFQYFPPAFL